jgi:putative addiction module antidote
MTLVKITQVGKFLGVILPDEVLARLNARKGDKVNYTVGPDGMVLYTVPDREPDPQMAAARNVARKQRGALRKLAK